MSNTQIDRIKNLILGLLIIAIPFPVEAVENFEDVEIRVIRPRFFNKTKKMELGAEVSMIMLSLIHI